MTDKRVVVPEGMLTAFRRRWNALPLDSKEPGEPDRVGSDHYEWLQEECLRAALLHQREHPPVPTDADILNMANTVPSDEDYITKPKNYCVEWIRRMYDAPDEPKGIDDLLPEKLPETPDMVCQNVKARIREAYARGLKERG